MVLGESVRVTVRGVFKKRTYLNGLSEELYRQLYMQLDPPGVIITTPMNSAGAGCLAGLLLYNEDVADIGKGARLAIPTVQLHPNVKKIVPSKGSKAGNKDRGFACVAASCLYNSR